jgi:hypothetical protein
VKCLRKIIEEVNHAVGSVSGVGGAGGGWPVLAENGGVPWPIDDQMLADYDEIDPMDPVPQRLDWRCFVDCFRDCYTKCYNANCTTFCTLPWPFTYLCKACKIACSSTCAGVCFRLCWF